MTVRLAGIGRPLLCPAVLRKFPSWTFSRRDRFCPFVPLDYPVGIEVPESVWKGGEYEIPI
jgi:hypothetical protein